MIKRDNNGKPELVDDQEVATFAGGCFWGMQDLIRKIPGVLATEVGYTGGGTKDPTYQTVKVGNTGHAESIEIIFDPKVLTFERLLTWFFKIHDPTTTDRQGNDIGSQYRSAIFFHDATQEQKAIGAKTEAAVKWKKPAVTQIIAAKRFYPAEGYHQDYLVRYPEGYTCHWVRDL